MVRAAGLTAHALLRVHALERRGRVRYHIAHLTFDPQKPPGYYETHSRAAVYHALTEVIIESGWLEVSPSVVDEVDEGPLLVGLVVVSLVGDSLAPPVVSAVVVPMSVVPTLVTGLPEGIDAEVKPVSPALLSPQPASTSQYP